MNQHPHDNNDREEKQDERNRHDSERKERRQRDHDERQRHDGEREERRDRNDDDELFTLAEVADLLRISPATLRYWRYEHTGPRSFRIGRHVRYRRTDVFAWIARQINNGSGDAA